MYSLILRELRMSVSSLQSILYVRPLFKYLSTIQLFVSIRFRETKQIRQTQGDNNDNDDDAYILWTYIVRIRIYGKKCTAHHTSSCFVCFRRERGKRIKSIKIIKLSHHSHIKTYLKSIKIVLKKEKKRKVNKTSSNRID